MHAQFNCRTRSFLRQLLAACCAALSFASAGVNAQGAYPEKPIHLIVPFGPGGITDAVARIIALDLQRILGQPVVVNNKEGASGMIGSTFVARAQPDGYTLLFATNVHVINPAIRKKLPFDPSGDFTPIAKIASSPLMLVVNSASPIKSVAEYIAAAKSSPGAIGFASSGIGTSPHLAAEQFAQATGTRYLHVPFNVSSAVTRAVVAGDVVSSWSGVQAILPYVKDGKLRALAVASEHRSPFAPTLPTFAELGIPGVNIDTWYGLFGPAKMPAPLVEKISATVLSVLQQKEIKEKLAAIGAEPEPLGSSEFRKSIAAELVAYKQLALRRGITVD